MQRDGPRADGVTVRSKPISPAGDGQPVRPKERTGGSASAAASFSSGRYRLALGTRRRRRSRRRRRARRWRDRRGRATWRRRATWRGRSRARRLRAGRHVHDVVNEGDVGIPCQDPAVDRDALGERDLRQGEDRPDEVLVRVLQESRVDLPEDVARLRSILVRDRGRRVDGQVSAARGLEDEDRVRVAASVERQRDRAADQDVRRSSCRRPG